MRLIDADKTLEHIKKRLLETALNNSRVVCDAAYLYADISDNRIETWINESPTVDVEPVSMGSINDRGYFVFLHDHDDTWDCIGVFKTYEEAVECSEEYRKYGEVQILTDVWTVVREVLG